MDPTYDLFFIDPDGSAPGTWGEEIDGSFFRLSRSKRSRTPMDMCAEFVFPRSLGPALVHRHKVQRNDTLRSVKRHVTEKWQLVEPEQFNIFEGPSADPDLMVCETTRLVRYFVSNDQCKIFWMLPRACAGEHLIGTH